MLYNENRKNFVRKKNMEDTQIPDSFKLVMRRQFELAAKNGKWAYFGGKIIVEVQKKEIGKKQKIKGVSITETITEI